MRIKFNKKKDDSMWAGEAIPGETYKTEEYGSPMMKMDTENLWVDLATGKRHIISPTRSITPWPFLLIEQ